MPLVRVGRSLIAGQGLFAAADIPHDTHIIEYTGEKISTRESHRRLAQGNAYIFRLNYRYAIDGEALENLARYINHSCDPNCASDKIAGRLWIIAIRDIQAGEELTYNYGYTQENYQQYPCTCGAKNCCGYILDQEYWGLIRRPEQ
jgi:SET domain-containing protein